jgi:hypothetical protein
VLDGREDSDDDVILLWGFFSFIYSVPSVME